MPGQQWFLKPLRVFFAQSQRGSFVTPLEREVAALCPLPLPTGFVAVVPVTPLPWSQAV